MLKNFDRVLSITSLLIGLISILVSLYLASNKDSYFFIGILGWVTCTLLSLIFYFTTLAVVRRLESEIKTSKDETIKAKNECLEKSNDLAFFKSEFAIYKNIASSLSSVIDPEPLKNSIREKLSTHLGHPKDNDEQS